MPFLRRSHRAAVEEAFIVHDALLLEEVELQPVVESGHFALTNLANEDVLEAAGVLTSAEKKLIRGSDAEFVKNLLTFSNSFVTA